MSDFNVRSDAQDLSWYSSTTHSASAGGYGTGTYAPPTGNTSSFEEEAPLLEELGIDIPGIIKKSKAILLLQLESSDLNDLDMGGPLVFAAALGAIHLIMGKLHFGVILGWSIVAACILAFVVNQMAGDGNPDAPKLVLYSVCCLLGYCLMPIVLLSVLSLLIPGTGVIRYGLAAICVTWATYLATSLFVRRSVCLADPFTKRRLYARVASMRRIARLLAVSTILTPVWLAIVAATSDSTRLLVVLSPFLLLILFGLYMLVLLIIGVMTFKTVPEEAAKLMQDIREAKEDLIKRGVLES